MNDGPNPNETDQLTRLRGWGWGFGGGGKDALKHKNLAFSTKSIHPQKDS